MVFLHLKRDMFRRACAAVFVLALSFQMCGCATYNTATGRREFIFISTDSEVTMGRSFDAQLKQEYKVSQDKEKADRVNRIGQKLVSVSDRQDFQYHFTLIEKDELNAFTLPGGYIYFFTGLYDKLSDDDEIAAVLAHEIGHSAARHTVKKYQAALGYDLVSRILFARFSSDVARQVASLGGGLVANIAMSAYGRRDEYEADHLGIKYMRLAGYDLNGMIRTFQILKANSKGPEPPTFLRTHPYIDDRIKAVQKEIQDSEAKY
jgi:predicted Zn-dependent protease